MEHSHRVLHTGQNFAVNSPAMAPFRNEVLAIRQLFREFPRNTAAAPGQRAPVSRGGTSARAELPLSRLRTYAAAYVEVGRLQARCLITSLRRCARADAMMKPIFLAGSFGYGYQRSSSCTARLRRRGPKIPGSPSRSM